MNGADNSSKSFILKYVVVPFFIGVSLTVGQVLTEKGVARRKQKKREEERREACKEKES